MKKNISKILICCLFLSFALFQANFCLAADNSDSVSADSNLLNLEVPIFDYRQSSGLPDYIATLFKYAMIVLIPLAILMVILGGISWIAAAGNPQKIKSAQSQIFSAILGLILGLLTYTLLSFVGITQLKMAGVKSIGPDEGMPLIIESQGTASATYTSVGGQCFPVATASLDHISWNWGARRNDGNRCHAGIDIYTKGQGQVVAIADGSVTSVGHFYNCSGGSVDRVIINHGSYTINYGEINSGKEASGITTGAKVVAGQVLGVATNCHMLHMELYQGSVSTNSTWYPPSGQAVGSGNYCRDNFLSTKPAVLQDPTNTVKDLQGKMCGN
jgi:hypothetical protein